MGAAGLSIDLGDELARPLTRLPASPDRNVSYGVVLLSPPCLVRGRTSGFIVNGFIPGEWIYCRHDASPVLARGAGRSEMGSERRSHSRAAAQVHRGRGEVAGPRPAAAPGAR